MSAAWVTIVGLTLTTAGIKAAGPVLLGGRPLPGPLRHTIAYLAPALLSALVVVQTFGDRRSLVLDARAAGLAVAGVCIATRRPLLVTVTAAAAVTALARGLG